MCLRRRYVQCVRRHCVKWTFNAEFKINFETYTSWSSIVCQFIGLKCHIIHTWYSLVNALHACKFQKVNNNYRYKWTTVVEKNGHDGRERWFLVVCYALNADMGHSSLRRNRIRKCFWTFARYSDLWSIILYILYSLSLQLSVVTRNFLQSLETFFKTIL